MHFLPYIITRICKLIIEIMWLNDVVYKMDYFCYKSEDLGVRSTELIFEIGCGIWENRI